MKQLIVNADDFGFTQDVNAGIIKAHKEGVLTSTTLMANGEAFDHAVALAGETPTLDVGIHLVLVGGRSLVSGKMLPKGPRQLLSALASRRIGVETELSMQIEKVLAAGIRPTHLDTHKHTHVVPPVFRAVLRMAKAFGIPWIRVPFGSRVYQQVVKRQGLFCTDYFRGFRLTGLLDEARFADALARLPDGLTEFMCHPGLLGAELRKAPTRLKESRQRELEALTAPSIQSLIANSGIRLCSFRDVRI